jgi:dihydropyrimidinase
MNVDYDLYEGETASGSVRHTYCRGTLVYDRGEIRTQRGHGRYVARSVAATRPAPAEVAA